MFQVQVHGILENPFFFTMVLKLASRIVLFYWYRHRLLNFWYRDTPIKDRVKALSKRLRHHWASPQIPANHTRPPHSLLSSNQQSSTTAPFITLHLHLVI